MITIYLGLTMFRAKEIIFLIVLFLIVPSMLSAVTMREAMDSAAEYFIKKAVRIESGQKLYITEVVNYANKENDIEGKKIETEIYFALERQIPDFKLFLGRGQNSDKETYLRGTYDLTSGQVIVKFQVFKGNQILAQTEVAYGSKTIRKTLVAVLDLEASMLNEDQRKTFSDIFRGELTEIGAFDLASSSDVDKMNPDEIQVATGCTRDTCATIIGEQLGVDRVISSSLRKIDTNFFYLSGKMMDIKDGSILVSKTVEHNGSLRTLKEALDQLAQKITDQPAKIDIAEHQKQVSLTTNEGSSLQQFPQKLPGAEFEEDSGWPWWYWAAGAALLGVVAAAAGGGDETGADSGSPESCSAGAGNCGSTEITW